MIPIFITLTVYRNGVYTIDSINISMVSRIKQVDSSTYLYYDRDNDFLCVKESRVNIINLTKQAIYEATRGS